MQQREEHFLFLAAIHGWKIPVLGLYKNLVLVFSSPPVFTLSWGKIITIIYLAWCQLRVWTLEHLKRQGIKARNFLPSYYHVCSFKKHKACVVWLPWTLWAGGRQNGSKQHQSSRWHFATKNIFQRRTLFCVDDTWNGIFFTRYWSYFPLFTNGGCCNWFSRLLKISLCKKINQKIRHFVFHSFLRFCYFCYILTVVTLVITDKAGDKCTLEANYSMLFISMYKNGKIIPIQRQ